ncbi:tigger transposable element-derived protein [Plakobranchus ocellatus]|uniref:Tigger transposable element-derived protein n=1 Tax=Plakobranchus ocellatus TaxID=259542 RepID=A0AAV4BCK2_9GAST|nr:tigger transposable element-derived protein [Plakobranchus ocellatus]
MQPLDRTIFGRLKMHNNKAINSWMYNHPGKRQTIHDVAGILGAAYSRAFTLDNAISGFRATGICPLNDEVFSEADFYQCYLSDTLCQQRMDTETPTPTCQDAIACSTRTSAADCPADPNAASHCLTEMSSYCHAICFEKNTCYELLMFVHVTRRFSFLLFSSKDICLRFVPWQFSRY